VSRNFIINRLSGCSAKEVPDRVAARMKAALAFSLGWAG
jgi:hypothetical protein